MNSKPSICRSRCQPWDRLPTSTQFYFPFNLRYNDASLCEGRLGVPAEKVIAMEAGACEEGENNRGFWEEMAKYWEEEAKRWGKVKEYWEERKKYWEEEEEEKR